MDIKTQIHGLDSLAYLIGIRASIRQEVIYKKITILVMGNNLPKIKSSIYLVILNEFKINFYFKSYTI